MTTTRPDPASVFTADELEGLVSVQRFASFRQATTDPAAAVALYTWNARVSGAFAELIQHVEVLVRNAMHRRLTAHHAQVSGRPPGKAWFDEPLGEASLVQQGGPGKDQKCDRAYGAHTVPSGSRKGHRRSQLWIDVPATQRPATQEHAYPCVSSRSQVGADLAVVGFVGQRTGLVDRIEGVPGPPVRRPGENPVEPLGAHGLAGCCSRWVHPSLFAKAARLTAAGV